VFASDFQCHQQLLGTNQRLLTSALLQCLGDGSDLVRAQGRRGTSDAVRRIQHCLVIANL
jgi:hypothetical protein